LQGTSPADGANMTDSNKKKPYQEEKVDSGASITCKQSIKKPPEGKEGGLLGNASTRRSAIQ